MELAMEDSPNEAPLTNEQIVESLDECAGILKKVGLALADRGQIAFDAEEMNANDRRTALNIAYITGLTGIVVVGLTTLIDDSRTLLGVPRPAPDLSELLKVLGIDLELPSDEDMERFENRENN